MHIIYLLLFVSFSLIKFFCPKEWGGSPDPAIPWNKDDIKQRGIEIEAYR